MDRVLGARTEITTDDLTRLEYTECVLKEALRKWPVVAGISRESDTDIDIKGFHVPKNTWFMVTKFIHFFKIMPQSIILA